MGKSSSSFDEETIRHRFDSFCKKALKGEVADYERHMAYRREHEITFSELSEQELRKLYATDEYKSDSYLFQALGYDIEVRDALIAETLQLLTEKKRNVVLLSYFMDMSDAEIAREMNLVRSTIHEHRKRSLEQMKKIMEETMDGRKESSEKS